MNTWQLFSWDDFIVHFLCTVMCAIWNVWVKWEEVNKVMRVFIRGRLAYSYPHSSSLSHWLAYKHYTGVHTQGESVHQNQVLGSCAHIATHPSIVMKIRLSKIQRWRKRGSHGGVTRENNLNNWNSNWPINVVTPMMLPIMLSPTLRLKLIIATRNMQSIKGKECLLIDHIKGNERCICGHWNIINIRRQR